MMSLVHSAATFGVEAVPIKVEVDVRPGSPRMSIVGLPDVATTEAKYRLIPALHNSGCSPEADVVINLAPSHIRKEGTAFDLAMAIGLQVSKGLIPKERVEKTLFLGELALDGRLRKVRGVLAAAECARSNGFKTLLVPKGNGLEATLVPEVTVYEAQYLTEVVQFLKDPSILTPMEALSIRPTEDQSLLDFRDVKGHKKAKRALEIAAAGNHHVLMVGPPGSGKSMLGKRLPGIMPTMTDDEVTEVTRIYSCVGKLNDKQPVVYHRPFRAPHHTSSAIAIVGGGTHPRPGEVTQAHRGVLFLDEFPEFPRTVLEVLRQPLADRQVTISRASDQLTFPAHFLLVAAMNGCPCGWRGDPKNRCQCSETRIKNYHNRLSGALLDNIDLHVEVPALPISTIRKLPTPETTLEVRSRVEKAREVQLKRFGTPLITNNSMVNRSMERFCALPKDLEEWLMITMEDKGFTSLDRKKVLLVARTIADLDGKKGIESTHLREALSYRTPLYRD